MKVVAPRPRTLHSGDDSRGTGWLPTDLLSEQVNRLALFAIVGAALWTFGLFIDTVLVPLTRQPNVAWRAAAVEVTAIIVSIALFVYFKYSEQEATRKIDVGLGYMIFSAGGVAILNTQVHPPTVVTPNQISWTTLVILVSSMILQTSPRRMLAAALVAASLDPIGMGAAHLRGRAVPPMWDIFVAFLPNYVCAFIAMLPSSVLRRVGRRLREAEEFGSYRLVELLGHGGMGEVWRAEHRLLARDVAIKLVRPEVLGVAGPADTRLLLNRFEREARATAVLSSPHTIQVFDYGMTDDRTFYYVMELLSGRDLESLVREFGPVPANRAVFLLRQACHSLADAHARGFVHRDIKPANIYVCRKGLDYDFVKVLDFGLVKVKQADGAGLTVENVGQTTGTPAYMAPEVILGEAQIDRRADVYAIGCVAYYLLTGHLVFDAESSMKMLLQHVQARPLPPSSRTELRIPRELDDLVLACLEKDPDKRPQDAGDLWRLTCNCTSSEGWNQEAAKTWWELHLPELTGPLSLSQHPSHAPGSIVA
jgi:serine/threonine-protein kinase